VLSVTAALTAAASASGDKTGAGVGRGEQLYVWRVVHHVLAAAVAERFC
jgi:hypothetical protein